MIPLILGVATLADVVLLWVWDAAPQRFPSGSHEVIAALSLALIAVAFLVSRVSQRASAGALFKAALLAAAFLFWAANQYWPNSPRATLYNDLAIGLFVLDVFFVIAERQKANESAGQRVSESACAARRYDTAMKELQPVNAGRSFTRDEADER